MSRTITKTTYIPATATRGIGTGSVPFVDLDEKNTYSHTLSSNSSDSQYRYVTFEVDFQTTEVVATYFDKQPLSTVTKVELEFWSQHLDGPYPIISVSLIKTNAKPSEYTDTADLVSDIISQTPWVSSNIHSSSKIRHQITIGEDSDSVCEWFEDQINDYQWISAAFVANLPESSTYGECQIGGLIMSEGPGNGWSAYTDTYDVASPPRFIITWQEELTDSDSIEHNLNYTVDNPTENQTTPGSSLGGYASPNQIYSRASLESFVSATQTSIPITSTPAETSGLAGMGSEIMRFSGVEDKILLNVERGISPSASFTANPNTNDVIFLDTAKLFDNRPVSGTTQYRCISLVHTGYAVSDLEVFVRQNSNSFVQVDVGIEVPSCDTRVGTIYENVTNSTTVTSRSTEFLVARRCSADPINVGSTLFTGLYMTLDYDEVDGTPTIAKINSFSINDEITTITACIC